MLTKNCSLVAICNNGISQFVVNSNNVKIFCNFYFCNFLILSQVHDFY